MRGTICRVAFAVAVSTGAMEPANACLNDAGQDAVKITHLNMMLLVTALRCRGGADNFLPEYNRFVVNNSEILGNQGKLIKTHLPPLTVFPVPRARLTACRSVLPTAMAQVTKIWIVCN